MLSPKARLCLRGYGWAWFENWTGGIAAICSAKVVFGEVMNFGVAAGSASTIILSIFSVISVNLSLLNFSNFPVRSSEMMGDMAIASRRESRACSAASRLASLAAFLALHLRQHFLIL